MAKSTKSPMFYYKNEKWGDALLFGSLAIYFLASGLVGEFVFPLLFNEEFLSQTVSGGRRGEYSAAMAVLWTMWGVVMIFAVSFSKNDSDKDGLYDGDFIRNITLAISLLYLIIVIGVYLFIL